MVTIPFKITRFYVSCTLLLLKDNSLTLLAPKKKVCIWKEAFLVSDIIIKKKSSIVAIKLITMVYTLFLGVNW